MAKKKTGKKVDFKEIVWVIDNLDTKQLATHDKAPYSSDDILNKLSEMIEDGFKISVKWDTYNNCYLSTAICDGLDYDNGGLALSARGQDVPDVLSLVMFKYYNVANRDLRGFADKIPQGARG